MCLQQKVGVQPTPACAALMARASSPPGCKKNNIFTSLCGAGYAVNVVPSCIYRTNGAQAAPASWTWTLSSISNSSQVSLDCAISGYSGPTTN